MLGLVLVVWSGLSMGIKERWGEDFYKYSVEHFVSHGLTERAENPAKVVKALKNAVMNSALRIRYRPGLQSPLFFPLSLAPAWLVDRILAIATGATSPSAGICKQIQT